jgi:hypothetical protein
LRTDERSFTGGRPAQEADNNTIADRHQQVCRPSSPPASFTHPLGHSSRLLMRARCLFASWSTSTLNRSRVKPPVSAHTASVT